MSKIPDILMRCREHVVALEANGLTAFDLLSWETLWLLEGDINWMSIGFHGSIVVEQVRRALVRKALALDELRETDFHSTMVNAKFSMTYYTALMEREAAEKHTSPNQQPEVPEPDEDDG